MPTSWFTPIDNYCERTDASFWSEPVNALTNGAFLLGAAYALTLWRGQGAGGLADLWLIAVTAIIGTGSFLFHTFANRWSALADVLPIAVFIYSYFFIALRRYLGLRLLTAVAATALFAGFNMSFSRLWLTVFPGVTLNGSVGYMPAAMALAGVGSLCLLVTREREAGRALLWAAGVFAVSLFFRSIDAAACAAIPMGTHFLWHMLNALVLGILMAAAIAHSSREKTTHALR